MKARGFVSFVLSESRGARGRLLFFALCVAIGVAAVVGVASLSSSLRAGIRAQSKQLLAADFVAGGRRPLPAELDSFFALYAERDGYARTDVRELATMAAVREPEDGSTTSRLVELKVIDGAFPFYGELVLDPPGDLAELLDAESALVAPYLLIALDVEVGDEILVGGASFRIAGAVLDEPDRLEFSIVLGPRVFLTATGLERTALLGVGNRVKYKALYRLPGDPTKEELAALRDEIRAGLPGADYMWFQTFADAQRGLRRGIDRFGEFLGLVALLSLVLGGIGVAQIVRSWLASRTTGIAVLRTLGLRPREILWLYLAHVVLLACLGSAVGAAVGSLAPFLLPLLAPDMLPPDLFDGLQERAALRGFALGVGVAVLFSLPALTAVWRVSPALVLRAEAQPLTPPRIVRWTALGLLLAGLFASATIQGGDAWRAAWFSGGLFVLAGLLWAGAWLLMRATALMPRRRLNPYLLTGFAALSRPGAGTVGAIVALGLGVLVVGSMILVQNRLEEELAGALPEKAPSVFMVDIQPDQWDGIQEVLAEQGAEEVESVPVIMGRLAAIDDVSVADILEERRENGRERPRWVLTREQRLTIEEELSEHSTLVEGELWQDPEHPEISLEEGFAEDLRVGLGSKLTFDVQGVPIDMWVTSIRTVEWESFAINFFLVAEPGVLDDAPQFRLATARLGDAGEQAVQDRLTVDYPNVTLLRIRAILEKVAGLLGRLALGIRMLGGFTILVGLVILAGSVAATQVRRASEVALLKTLGVTRRGIVLLFATEFALCGFVAGALGGLGALALAWAFLEHVAELEARLPLASLPIAACTSAVFATVAGIAASARALAVRPLESMRHG